MRRARDGDQIAYGELVRAYQLPLRAVTARYLADPEDVLDIVQEAFFAAWRQLGDFDVERPFWPWIRTIARNLALKQVRQRSRHLRRGLLDEVAGPESEAEDDDQRVDLLRRMRGCLQDLAPEQRRLMRERFYQRRSVQDLADDHGLRPNTLSMRLHRLRELLKRCVEGAGEEA